MKKDLETEAPEKIVYLAGPLFTIYERSFLEKIDSDISEIWSRIGRTPSEGHQTKESICFVPHRDAGDVGTRIEEKEDIFEKDLLAIDNAKIIIAVLDGVDVDSGTAVELGYSYTHNKKILGLLTDKRRWKTGQGSLDDYSIIGLNNMVWGVCTARGKIYGTLEALYLDVETYLMEFVASE